jgi:hypothetical protein
MNELGGIVAETFAALLGHPLVAMLVQALLAAAVVLWLVCAWWTFRDLATRTHDPVAPYLAAAGVLLSTPLFFPLALVVYRLVRPPHPSAADEILALRLAALGAEPEASCPSCGRATRDDWRRCPACGLELTLPCDACGHPVRTGWSICAWCARELPGRTS